MPITRSPPQVEAADFELQIGRDARLRVGPSVVCQLVGGDLLEPDASDAGGGPREVFVDQFL